MPDEELPEPVAAAADVLKKRHGVVTRMIAGIGLCVLSMVGFAMLADGSPYEELFLQATTFAMLAWMVVHVGLLVSRRAESEKAKRVYGAWEQRDIEREILGTTPGATAPDDPRWEALERVIGRIREHVGPDETPLVDATEDRLCGLLHDVAALREAEEAEGALASGEASDRRLERIHASREALEGQVGQLSDALRDLHVELATQDTGGTSTLVDRLRATLEVIEAEHGTTPGEGASGGPKNARLPREPIRDTGRAAGMAPAEGVHDPGAANSDRSGRPVR